MPVCAQTALLLVYACVFLAKGAPPPKLRMFVCHFTQNCVNYSIAFFSNFVFYYIYILKNAQIYISKTPNPNYFFYLLEIIFTDQNMINEKWKIETIPNWELNNLINFEMTLFVDLNFAKTKFIFLLLNIEILRFMNELIFKEESFIFVLFFNLSNLPV